METGIIERAPIKELKDLLEFFSVIDMWPTRSYLNPLTLHFFIYKIKK